MSPSFQDKLELDNLKIQSYGYSIFLGHPIFNAEVLIA